MFLLTKIAKRAMLPIVAYTLAILIPSSMIASFTHGLPNGLQSTVAALPMSLPMLLAFYLVYGRMPGGMFRFWLATGGAGILAGIAAPFATQLASHVIVLQH